MDLQPFSVPELPRNQRTIAALIVKYNLIDKGVRTQAGFLAKISQEIWNDPFNATLKNAANRDTVDEAGAKVPLLAPEETVYLPVPLPSQALYEKFQVTTEKSLAEICAKIKTKLASSSRRTWPGPLTPASLFGFSYNAGFRVDNPDAPSKGISKGGALYYGVVDKRAQHVAVAPNQGRNKAVATPAWLHEIWQDIETIRSNTKTVNNFQTQMADLRKQGGDICAAALGLQSFLKIAKEHTNARVDGVSMALETFALTVRTDVLLDLKASFVPAANAAASKLVDLILKNDILKKNLKKLKEKPRLYTLTTVAFCGAVQEAIEALLCSVKANDLIPEFDKIIKGEDPSSLWKEIGDLIIGFSNGIGAVAGVSVGNTPGPMSLAVCIARFSLLSHLPSNMRVGAPTLERYGRYLGHALGFEAHVTEELVKDIGSGKKMLSAAALKVKAAELHAGNTHTSAAWGVGIGILNIIALASAVWQLGRDINTGENTSTIVGDIAGILGASLGTASAVVQVMINFPKYAAMSTAGISWALSVVGLISGCITIYQGIHEDKGLKIAQGIGNSMASLGCMLDMVLVRFGPQLAIRAATAIGVEAVAVESTVMAIGATVATACTFIGIAIVIGVIVIQNWPAIKEAFGTTGQEKLMRTGIAGLEGLLGPMPGSVKSAFASAKSSHDGTTYDDFSRKDTDVVTKQLRTLGLNDGALKIVFDRAILSDMGDQSSSMGWAF